MANPSRRRSLKTDLDFKTVGWSILLLYTLLASSGMNAQQWNDTLDLPEFELKSEFVLDNLGFKRMKMDSSLFMPNLTANLSDILAGHSTVFIKSYGNGTLSTPSFRGTSAQHTQVEWNGISLNSPMLGQMDFSKVPVAQFDGLEILFGAAGIARTAGAFGGVIDLVTSPDWNNRFNIYGAQTIASFGQFVTNVDLLAGGKSFQSHTRLNYTTSQNDFPFTNDQGERVRQQNASYLQSGILEELFWKIRDRHLLSGKVWYSRDDRNIPPTTQTFDSLRSEKLKENALRAVLEYKYVVSGWNLSVRTALNDQYMNYSNSFLELNSTHRTYSWINKIRLSWFGTAKFTFKPGVDFVYDHVKSDDYQGIKTRTTTSLFGEINYRFNTNLNSSLVVREDIIDGSFQPVIAAAGIDYRPFQKADISFSLNLARNYRFPTLNELYWKVYGNPSLEPELNYSAEGGTTVQLATKDRQFYLEVSLAGYFSWIYDMITWTPVEGSGGLFRPENVDQIFSRGAEVGLNMNLKAWGFGFNMKNNYNFCRSTYEKAGSIYENKIGNQVFYIPVNTFNSTLTLSKWKFYLAYNFTFIGDRYTGADNVSFMPAYNLSDIILGKNIQLKQFSISLQVNINNLFNLDYQSVANRPMPGINYGLTLKLGFDNKGKEQEH